MPKIQDKVIDNARLDQIAQRASERLPELIGEGEKQIIADYHDAVQQAHDQAADKLPKLKLTYVIAFDPQTGGMDCDLKWTVTRVISESEQLEDPNQPEFPEITSHTNDKPARRTNGRRASSAD